MGFINNVLKNGFREIEESESPIIFNITKPRYFRKDDMYAVAGTDGFTLSWNDKTERDNILNDAVITAVLNFEERVEDEDEE